MKTSTLVTLVSAVNIAAATQFISGPEEWASSNPLWNVVKEKRDPEFSPRHILESRQTMPAVQQLKNRNPHIPNAKSVKVRYGPYTVPGARVPGGEGMLWNNPSPIITKPCKDCMLLGLNAGLEYPDGADANTDTLMWLHHMVMFNIGTGIWDATCTLFGAPHLIVGAAVQSSERFFSSGNERTTTFFNPPWAGVTNLGYPVYNSDRFGLIADLMNMNQQPKTVWLTVYFDYIDGHPANMEEVKPVWLDAAQCMTSEVSGRTPGAKFDFSSSPWTANFEGEVMGMGGHLHDGGVRMDIIVDGKVVCQSMPTYGTDEQARARADVAKAGGIAAASPELAAAADEALHHSSSNTQMEMGGGHGHMGGQHIIAMSICADNKAGIKDIPISPVGIKDLRKGQKWVLRAYYDYKQHPGMQTASGSMENVMGIAIMYAKTVTKRTAGSSTGGILGWLGFRKG